MNIRPASPLDVFVWPDDMTGPTWCFREDAGDYTHMSDDYRVLPEGSDEAEEFLVQEYAS